MYSILIPAPLDETLEQDLPLAMEPELCIRLADERDSSQPQLQLSFHVGRPCLLLDYIVIRNVSIGVLCSQRFIDILVNESVPFTAYPAQLFEWNTERLIEASYFFWIPKWVKDAIDWDQSESWLHVETGVRRLTKLVLKTDCERIAPLLFHTKGRGYYLIHDRLRVRLTESGITGVLFAPLDAAYAPYSGAKRMEIERTLQDHPDDWVHWSELSDTLVSERHYKEALESLNRALTLKPDLWEAWEKRGKILYTLGNLEEALEALQKAIELQPQMRTQGQSDSVQREVARTAGQLANREHLAQMRAWILYCAVLRELGRIEEALAIALYAVQTWDSSPLPRYELAATYAALGHNEEALEAIEQGLARRGGSRLDDLFLLKGETLYKLGRYEEALATYELRLPGTSWKRAFWQGKAKTLQALGRSEEALQAEKQAQELERQWEENLKKKPM